MPEPPRTPPGQPGGDAAQDTARLSAALAVQAAIIRDQAALLSGRERAVASAAAGLWECRLGDEALTWSDGVYDLFGMPRGARLHRPQILDLYEPSSHRLLRMVRDRAIARGGRFRLDAEIVTAQGHDRWIRIWAAVESEGGRPARIHGMKQDVTEEVARLGVLSRRADRDALTGLANRHAFDERFSPAPPDALRDPPGALVLVDLDGFKQVNDSHGHAAGDLCLRHAAARLAAACADADLVARIGGDEFAVLLRAPVDPRALAALGRRIVTAIGRPIAHDGRTLRVGASVGIACGGMPASELFTRADAALYGAKAAGRNTVRIDGAGTASEPVRPA